MKKILTILAALIVGAATFHASAQLTINGAGEGVQQLATISPMCVWLNEHDGTVFLTVKSSNRYDPFFWLDLGPDYEVAIETLQSLEDALKNAKRGDYLHIESRGDRYVLTKDVALGSQMWRISAVETRNTYAGTGMLELVVIENGIRALGKLTKK